MKWGAGSSAHRASTKENAVNDDTNMIQDGLWEHREKKKVFRLPAKCYRISRTLIRDAVPIGPALDDRGMVVLRWRGEEGGVMMEVKNSTPGQYPAQRDFVEGIIFDGNNKASAVRITNGFTHDSTVERCHFWRCRGPVLTGEKCWNSVIQHLTFTYCTGNLVTLHHSAGVLRSIMTHRCSSDTSGAPAIVLRGTAGSVTDLSFDGSTHYPGLPLLRFEGCQEKVLRSIRTEGGVVGVSADSVVELVNCFGCVVIGVRAVFQNDTPGRCAVRAVGGADNVLVGVSGGRNHQPEGCVVEHTAGAIVPVAVRNMLEPGDAGYCPTFREILAE